MIRTTRDRENPYPTDTFTLSDYVRIGRVVEVYDKSILASSPEKYGCVKVIWIDVADPNITNENEVVRCLTPGASWAWGSGIYRLPHINDMVAVLQLPTGSPLVIGYIPYALKEAVSVSEDTVNSEIGSLPPLGSGDILLKSSGQNEVFISNDGVVRVITRDNSNKDTIYAENVQTNTEPSINRVNGSDQNITSIFTLGKTTKTLGCGAVVAELDIPSYTQETTPVSIKVNNTSTVVLPYYNNKVPTKILGLTHVSNNNSTYYSGDHCILTTTFSYTSTNTSDYSDLNLLPLTLDNTLVTSTVTLSSKLQSIIKAGDIIRFDVLYKSSLSNLQFNNLGDCQLTGRNIVLKNNKNVSLGLFDDGSLRLSAAKTEIGDTTTGHVRLDTSGVSISKGINTNADVKVCTNDVDVFGHLTLGGTETVTGRHYFAINDNMPLFCYDTQEEILQNKIKVVTKDEYTNLGSDIRLNIPYKSVNMNGPLSLKVIEDAINRGKQEQGVVYNYGELRR